MGPSVTYLHARHLMAEISLKDLTPDEVSKAGSQFQQLCRLTSVEEAVALCAKYGGMLLNLPSDENNLHGKFKETTLRNELRDILCGGSYKKLLYELGGTKYELPKLNALIKKRRDMQIRASVDAAIKNGESFANHVHELVVRHGITRRHIYRILKQSD
jgi:hypothetical protein